MSHLIHLWNTLLIALRLLIALLELVRDVTFTGIEISSEFFIKII